MIFDALREPISILLIFLQVSIDIGNFLKLIQDWFRIIFITSPQFSTFHYNLAEYFDLSASGIFIAAIACSADHFIVSIKFLIV